jgi:hypothetical protein
MVVGLLLAIAGIGAFCVLIYKAAVFALPVAVGFWCGFAALHSGSGVVVAFAVGFVAGAIVFGIAQSVWNSRQPRVFRYAIVLLFVVPAVWSGYCATEQLSALVVPSAIWRAALAVVGAVAVGLTAFARLTIGAYVFDLQTTPDGRI